MGYDSRLEALPSEFPAPRSAWPALALALAFGVVEWLALVRSRGADQLRAAWRALRA